MNWISFTAPLYLDRHVRANSVKPDQTPQKEASDQSLLTLQLIQQILDVF